MLLCALCCCIVAVAQSSDTVIKEGIYTIKNKQNNQNLNVFDFSYSDEGYAYTDKASGDDGENILFVKQSDGTFLLYPQSENGKFAFRITDGKLVKAEETFKAYGFSISFDGDAYVITDNDGNALTLSSETAHKKPLVSVSEYNGSDAQKWELTKVSVTSFSLKMVTRSNTVNLNSVSAVYALVTPSYMKNLIKWHSSDESVVMIDDDGTFCAVGAGKATVTAVLDDVIKSIEITVVDAGAFAWYSQHLATIGGWYGDELSNVYFQSGGTYKRYIVNGYNKGLDWMDQGCFLTSLAMVLRNLGARYNNGYDFRFDQDKNLEVDPYVMALANTGNRGLTMSSGTLYNDPIRVRYGPLERSFSLYGQPIKFKQSYDVTKESLKKMLDKHPEGVIVTLKNFRGTHYVVVTECINPEATPENYRFKIYDSAGLKVYDGNNVPFELSISATSMHYNYSHMRSMAVFDIVPTED